MNFNEGLNIESFRERNIRTINNLFKEFESYKKDMSSTKSKILVSIYNNKDYKTSEERENAWDVACDTIEDEIIEQKKELKKNLRKTIRIQAKELLRLKSNEEIYNYYKMISEKPLSDEYNPIIETSLKDFESDVYRQFLMANPRIENIVISYSELEFEKNSNLTKKEDKNINIEEILYYLDVALNSSLEESKRRQALDIAYDLTSKLEDAELKEDLYADLASAYDSINKDNTTIVDPDYEYAKELVEKAEKTQKSDDFFKALNALEKLDEEKRNELAARLNEVRKKAEERFVELIEEIKNEVVNKDSLDNEKFLELEDKYKFISKDLAKEYKEDFSNIIIFNNNLKQIEVKETYEKKKTGFFEKIGKIVTFVKGSKIISKFNAKRLLKLKAAAQDADEEEINDLEQKAEKVSNKLAAGSVVGGLKLFVAQESLERMKPKLYNGEELSPLKTKIYNKAIQMIDKQMNKGLDAKSNLIIEAQDKKYVTSVIDQYLYLIATGNDYDASIEKVNEYLEKVSDHLTDAEESAIREQIYIIKDYRDAADGDIYEIKSNIEDEQVTTELDDIVKYFDSEEYNNQLRNTPIYIKR